MIEETPTPTARIERIEVVGLFGLYNHVIDLNLEDRVTILHGPNGVGKTVLLHMVRSILGRGSPTSWRSSRSPVSTL